MAIEFPKLVPKKKKELVLNLERDNEFCFLKHN